MKPFDVNGVFRSQAEGAMIGRLAVRGAGATLLAQALMLAVQVVSTVVLARLLLPRDFGVVTMVTTFSLLVVGFGLNGFTEAVLNWEEINHFLISNLFWINVSGGVLLTITFAAAGPIFARFYKDPRVAPVAAGISLTILITSTSVQHLALLKRAMRFSAISVNDIVARAVSVAVSISLACAGKGYWALVAGAISQPLSQALGAWFLCRWIPGLPRRADGTASMVRYAVSIYGRFCVNYFARNTDNVLVGWRFGSDALGFYKKAYDLFLLSASQLISPLTSVAVSALSRFNRNSLEYRRYILNAVAIMAFVGMGLGGGLTLVGRDVIRLALGPGWEPAGQIFTFFGPGIGIMLVYGTHGWIHLSIGTADRFLRWVIVEFTVTALLFLMGLHWGPAGIAAAWSASFWILTIPAFWYAGRPIGLGVAPVAGAIWKYILASLLAGCASAVIKNRIPLFSEDRGPVWLAGRIGITLLLFGILYIGGVILLCGGVTPLRQFGKLVRGMLPWGPISEFPLSQPVEPTSGASTDLAKAGTGEMS